jgi:hypothetical protein
MVRRIAAAGVVHAEQEPRHAVHDEMALAIESGPRLPMSARGRGHEEKNTYQHRFTNGPG